MLGGYHNFAVDREYARRIEEAAPGATAIVYANRDRDPCGGPGVPGVVARRP